MPVCKKCTQDKDIEKFYIRNIEKQTPTSYCRQCNKDRVKSWRKTPTGNKKWKEYDSKRTKCNMEWLKQQRSLGCEKCNDTRFYLVDFHHKDPDLKTFTIGATNRWTITQLKKEVNKCCRLCANCHREFHYREKNEQLTLINYLK